MKQYSTLFAVLTAVVFGYARPVDATVFTEQATLDVNSLIPADGPPIETVIQGFEGAGRLFTNTYQVAGFEGATQSRVRTVGAMRIDSLTLANTSTRFGIRGPGSSTELLTVVFGIDGFVQGVDLAGNVIAQFTEGRFGVFNPDGPGGEFRANDPTTWFDDLASPIYVATLGSPETVTTGNGFPLFWPEPTVNRSGANAIASTSTQGRFLFFEEVDPTAEQTADGSQEEFITITTGVPQPEGLASEVNQTPDGAFIETSGTGAIPGGNGGLTAAQQDDLNAIAEWAGLSDLGTDEHFATFGSDTLEDWDPTPDSPEEIALAGASDFSNTVTAQFYPISAPEPSSLALLAVGGALGGFFRSRRRRKQTA